MITLNTGIVALCGLNILKFFNNKLKIFLSFVLDILTYRVQELSGKEWAALSLFRA